MRRDEAIRCLKAEAEALRSHGAEALFLFGSTLRDEAGPGSDLDLFVDLAPHRRVTLFDLLAMLRLLEERTGAEVDLTTRDALHPLIKESIEASAVRVF
jgi:uncharacterized protein